ncbi:MAG: Ig-like domain-containing protein [Clostridiales Family XIII bacterium]|nr:Ig-like domain-containing protein [Clostridiales Family XIII bacterium]
MLKKGKTYQIGIRKLTKKASDINTVQFYTSNKKIATVDKAGKLVIKKKGKVWVTLKVGKKIWRKVYRIR